MGICSTLYGRIYVLGPLLDPASPQTQDDEDYFSSMGFGLDVRGEGWNFL
jgi:hypothetical protein